MRILFIGATGWLGSQLVDLLKVSPDNEIIVVKARLDNHLQLLQELNSYQDIDHIVFAAGLTGRPNVCWCESHHQEVMEVNVIAPSIVAKFCNDHSIHMTMLSSGCIYEYDEDHPIGGPGFTEIDEPNFTGSFYSYTKIMVENILKEFPTVLILRIRMPLADDLCERNFITKITKYKNVVDVANSMTVIHDMLPLIPDMMTKELTGIYNFCNTGTISHNQILDLYREYIDPTFTYMNFSLEEQAKILKAGRSNNCLDCGKLLSIYPNIPPISVAIVDLFKRMQKNLHKSPR